MKNQNRKTIYWAIHEREGEYVLDMGKTNSKLLEYYTGVTIKDIKNLRDICEHFLKGQMKG